MLLIGELAPRMLGDAAMPELPDITAYLTALTPRVVGQPLEQVRIASPMLLRTAIPPIQSVEGKAGARAAAVGEACGVCVRR